MDCLLRSVLQTTIVIARKWILQSSRSVGGLPFPGTAGFVPYVSPCLLSALSGITSTNWLNSFAGRGVSTRMIFTPYCAASLGSRGA
jgi:hypothetical protein